MVLCGHSSDLSDLSYTASAGDIRLPEIDRAPNNEILKSVACVQILTDGNGCLAFFAKNGVARDIFYEQWFLETKSAASRESFRSFESHVDGVTLVCVGHDNEVLAQLLPDSANYLNILIQVETDFNFYAVKSLFCKRAGPLCHLGRLFRIKSRRINRDFVATFPTKELIE